MTKPQVKIFLTMEEHRALDIASALEGAKDKRSFAKEVLMKQVEEILREHKIALPALQVTDDQGNRQ